MWSSISHSSPIKSQYQKFYQDFIQPDEENLKISKIRIFSSFVIIGHENCGGGMQSLGSSHDLVLVELQKLSSKL